MVPECDGTWMLRGLRGRECQAITFLRRSVGKAFQGEVAAAVPFRVLEISKPRQPLLQPYIQLLVQLADRRGRHPRPPQRLRDVIDAPHGDARDIHLDEGLLHRPAHDFVKTRANLLLVNFNDSGEFRFLADFNLDPSISVVPLF